MIKHERGIFMSQIRPISDLRNKFAYISQKVHENHDPIYLTKNGTADMVLMSALAFEKIKIDTEICVNLKEAELEAKTSDVRYSADDVFAEIRADIARCLNQGEQNE